MKKLQGNTILIILVAVLVILLIVSTSTAAYLWGKSKSENKMTQNNSNSTSTEANQTQIVPKKVVEDFMNYSIGTIKSASLNFDAAKDLLTEDLKAKFTDESSFAAKFYGYQDGPTSVTITSENINGSDASVKVSANWGETKLSWTFTLKKSSGKWLIREFRNETK